MVDPEVIERLEANSGSGRNTQFWSDVRALIEAVRNAEPEWEYSIAYPDEDGVLDNDGIEVVDSLEAAIDMWGDRSAFLPDDTVVRRAKAGPWQPIRTEGDQWQT